jgi:hypothetical protein
MCALYGVTRAGFYAWSSREESAHQGQDRRLLEEIGVIFAESGGTYGSPRVQRSLVERGFSVSRRRVERLMRLAGLRARLVRIYRSNPRLHRFFTQHPNRLWTNRATGPDQIWVGDITYLRVAGRWRFLSMLTFRRPFRTQWPSTRRFVPSPGSGSPSPNAPAEGAVQQRVEPDGSSDWLDTARVGLSRETLSYRTQVEAERVLELIASTIEGQIIPWLDEEAPSSTRSALVNSAAALAAQRGVDGRASLGVE